MPLPPIDLPVFILAVVLAALLGGLLVYLVQHRKQTALHAEAARLEAELTVERRRAEERLASLEDARTQLRETFGTMASQALKHNSGEFLKLARENLRAFQTHAEGSLSQREKAVETLVKPIREALEKTEVQIRHMEHERKEAYGSLTKHLETMAESQRLLQGETRSLVQALRRPEVRGQWGELTLKRLAELAGMVDRCDFFEQEGVQTDAGRQRPDMIIRMPDKREIIVDAKTPLDAYLNAIEASNDDTRRHELERHARKVRERVRELSSKAYWQQFPQAPDFVVLFIPGDQFLSSALEYDRQLLEDALAARVILATPTSFVALLRAIAFGWRQDALTENAEIIRKVGEDLYQRLSTFTEHLAKIGRSLDTSVNAYNKAVGSFDSRILPGARKFTELGIASKSEIAEPEQVERAARTVQAGETTNEDAIQEGTEDNGTS
ncbi:MAG: DNA recombination protein RmuC [Gammaproteobacteria bacterium]|nr:DNA recombination protein RmuC [Gammaproteobacteria bacterium]